jgi:hypothetical protein
MWEKDGGSGEEGRSVEVGSSGGWFEGEGAAKGKRLGGGRLLGEGESVFLFR